MGECRFVFILVVYLNYFISFQFKFAFIISLSVNVFSSHDVV